MEPMKYNVTAEQIALDLETLAEGMFEAETARERNALLISFTNGQQFLVTVQAVGGAVRPLNG